MADKCDKATEKFLWRVLF